MMEEEYQLEYFTSHSLTRKLCKVCGTAYWTRDSEKETCGDAPCEPYSFIGKPVFRPHTIDEMREAFLSFFERHAHTRLERYPVAARWRDDIYLTIASIADFQPYVTSGMVPPPANPLTISQPCIRLNDLDSVGRSGRHMTLFEMMAHHAFNTPDHEIYWKNETVALCDEFLASIGADIQRISYKEHPWVGGGNAGPSLEVLIGGLEVATLVFMNLGRQKTSQSPIMLDDNPYYPMKIRIVDTGYGLERFVWASQGSPTIYDAVFPEIVNQLIRDANIDQILKDFEFTKILALNAKFAGLMDVHGTNLVEMRKKIADSIGIPFFDLQRIISPFEQVYTIADHSRCLAYMLGDCIVPSNVRDGYLARLVLRRTLRIMDELNLTQNLADLVELQIRSVGSSSFEQSVDVIREIVDNEVERYRQTLDRGSRIVQRLAMSYKKKAIPIPVRELMVLYDSHGIPPEIVREIAAKEEENVELPDNFYSMIAGLHSQGVMEEQDTLLRYQERIVELPPTKKLYYEQPDYMEFDAEVLDYFDGFVVLNQTLFYPEGGGQPSDTGLLITEDGMARVDHTTKVGEIILHQIKGGVINRGDKVKGKIDEDKRRSLMRHHTATHVLLRAAKDVLGTHIHQAGAQKGSESSRLDIRHYKHITPDEIHKIELLANQMVMEDSLISIKWEDRTKAEQKYGFDLYQGGVPPGKEIRVVRVNRDVEACGGTHCRSTGEVGTIKIIRVEHVQDGIERIEFGAGSSAIYFMQRIEGLLLDSAQVLSVQIEKLPSSAQRFFNEWKDQRKEIARLRKKVADLELNKLKIEHINNVKVVIQLFDSTPEELVNIAIGIAKDGGIALLLSKNRKVHVVVSSGSVRVNASDIIQTVCHILGGKGGGTAQLAQGSGQNADFAEKALETGRNTIYALLHD